MKDPTAPPSDDRKKMMFYDSSDRQARLKIRCTHDGITQSQFFRMMISGYIDNDDLIYQFIKEYKERCGMQGQQKINKIESLRRHSKQSEKKFALKGEEIEDIFDVIEMETGL